MTKPAKPKKARQKKEPRPPTVITPEMTAQALVESEAREHELEAAYQEVLRRSNRDPVAFFAAALRNSIDSVIDGPRTGRYSASQLDKNEAAYIGTRIEIMARSELELPRQPPLDTVIADVPVDFKWSGASSWMIPGEYTDGARYPGRPLCLLLGTHGPRKDRFSVYLARPIHTSLRGNSDGKVSFARGNLKAQPTHSWRTLVENELLPPTYLSQLPAPVLTAILSAPAGQQRVDNLMMATRDQVVPRLGLASVAQQQDPTRRVRQDGDLRGYYALCGTWTAHREAAAYLGLPDLERGNYIPIDHARLNDLPPELKARVLKEK